MPDHACSAQQLLSAGIRTTNSRQLYPTLHQPADAGLPMLVIENALGKTVVALQGAHVMSFQPAGQPEMLWISPKTLLLDGAWESNGIQNQLVTRKLNKQLGGLKGKTVAVLGLTYKPDTSTLRRSASLQIIADLLAEGAVLRAQRLDLVA